MARCSIVALTLLLIAFGNPARLGSDEVPSCSGSGVYKPLTLYRKVQLATAYFVNPSLPDKAKIADVYRLSVQDVPEDELRQQIITGKLKLMVPVEKNDRTTLTSVGCAPLSKESVGSVYNKKDFSALLKKLKQGKGVVYFSSKQGVQNFKLPTKDGSFISWDPEQSVKLEKWSQKDAQPKKK